MVSREMEVPMGLGSAAGRPGCGEQGRSDEGPLTSAAALKTQEGRVSFWLLLFSKRLTGC